MKEREQYSYYAFISYSRKDEKWARWLQDQLETYRLPSALRKGNLNVPSRITPVFRDKTDLGGGRLEKVLHQELEASRYLIVICSPNSAASDWVNREIEYFVSLGREDAVIPFIVEGEPFAADPKKECFPGELRKENMSELLGISVPELGKKMAFLRVVSTLLGLKFDQVVMRDRRRAQKRMQAAMVFLLLLAGAAGFGIWYNTPHSAYFSSYVYSYEIPRGINKLSEKERQVTAECYRIETLRGKVVRMERVNSAGTVVLAAATNETDCSPVQIFEYDENGRLASVTETDVYGQELVVKTLSYSSEENEIVIDFRSPSDNSQVFTLPSDTLSMSGLDLALVQDLNRTEITRYRNTYDENGYLMETRYYRDSWEAAGCCDSNGVYGKRYEVRENGQILKIYNLNENGEVHSSKAGFAYSEYVYDEEDRLSGSFVYDAEGNPAVCSTGHSSDEILRDENGNITEMRFLDAEGKLYCREEGYAFCRLEHNAEGFPVSIAYFDALGEPAYPGENRVHKYFYVTDENGRTVREQYLDGDGNLCATAHGYAEVTFELDESGRLLEFRLYGVDGNPAMNKNSSEYGVRYEYDEQGRCSAVYSLDSSGALMLSRYGYAYYRTEFDENGNSVRTSYYDTEDQLIRGQENIAVIERTYDRAGNWTESAFLDENGQPCLSSYGYAKVVYAYENGNMVSEKYYNEAGQPVTGAEGYCEKRWEYDERGNGTRRSYYNEKGELTLLPEYYAATEQVFDSYGNITEIRYYDTENQLTQCSDGYYKLVSEFDERGNCIRTQKYSFSGRFSTEYSTVKREYDENNHVIRCSYYDTEDRLCQDEYGIVEYCYTYDGRNQLIREEYLDVDGNLSGAREYDYDERGAVMEERCYDGTEETCAYKLVYTYDAYGNRICEAYKDAEDRPITGEGGYASTCAVYDAAGNVIEATCYDEEGQPCLYEGYFRVTAEYDYAGNIVKNCYYDEAGAYISTDVGVPVITYEYTRTGLESKCTFYDEQGQLLDSELYGYCIREQLYADDGTLYETRFYDSREQLLQTQCSGIYIGGVEEGMAAEGSGLEVGDIVLQINDWKYLEAVKEPDLVASFSRVIRDLQQEEKELLVLRISEEGDAEFLEVRLPEGSFGLRFVDGDFTGEDLDDLNQLYESWQQTLQNNSEGYNKE